MRSRTEKNTKIKITRVVKETLNRKKDLRRRKIEKKGNFIEKKTGIKRKIRETSCFKISKLTPS